jgi:hypothetical protein
MIVRGRWGYVGIIEMEIWGGGGQKGLLLGTIVHTREASGSEGLLSLWGETSVGTYNLEKVMEKP